MGGWGKHNPIFFCGAFRKAKYEIRRRRKNRNRKARAGPEGETSFPYGVNKILAFCLPRSKPRALLWGPLERLVSAARSAAISQDFVQKRFELRSVIANE